MLCGAIITHIVAEIMAQRVECPQPLLLPLFAAVAPGSSPLAASPGIAYLDEPLPAVFDGFQDGVCVSYKRNRIRIGVLIYEHCGDEPVMMPGI
jgi:hypothetical protein